jgi:2-isopropylmalate synthase
VECTIKWHRREGRNASLEEIAMILHTRRELFNLETRIKTERIYPTSRLITSLTG